MYSYVRFLAYFCREFSQRTFTGAQLKLRGLLFSVRGNGVTEN
jgi:hypothetical protein